jgi:MFS family permease
MITPRLPMAKVIPADRTLVTLLGSLCLLQAATGVNWSIYFAFGGFFLAAKLGLSVAEVALLVSSSFLAYCVVQFGASLVVDAGVRLVGLRAMLLRSPILYGVGMTLIVLGPNATTVVVGGALAGLGAATLPLMLATISARTSKNSSSKMASLLGVSYLIGQVVALAAGWLLVNNADSHTGFFGLCAMWAVVAAVLLVTLWPGSTTDGPEAPLTNAFVGQVRTSFGALWRSLGDPSTRALKFIILIAGVAPVLVGIYIPLYLIGLVNDQGRSASYIAASTALGYLIGGISTPLLGTYTDRRRNAPGLMLAVLGFVAVVALTLSRTRDPLEVSVLAVALTVGGQWLNVLQNTIMLLEVPRERATTFFAANQLPFYGGLPLGLGLGIGAVGLTGSVANALLVVAAMFGVSAAVWGWHVRGLRRA